MQWIGAADRGADDGSGACGDSPGDDRGVRTRANREHRLDLDRERRLLAPPSHRLDTCGTQHQNMGVPMKDWGGVSSSIPECGVMLAG